MVGYVIFGSLITICNMLIGLLLGYLIGAKKMEKMVERIGTKLNPPKESGPVRPYTREEKEEMEPTAAKRIKELL